MEFYGVYLSLVPASCQLRKNPHHILSASPVGLGRGRERNVTGHLLLDVWSPGLHLPPCPRGGLHRGPSGVLSALQDAWTACLPAFFASLPLFSSLLISKASTWEKLNRLYLIMKIHISRIETSRIKVHILTKNKQLYLISLEASWYQSFWYFVQF